MWWFGKCRRSCESAFALLRRSDSCNLEPLILDPLQHQGVRVVVKGYPFGAWLRLRAIPLISGRVDERYAPGLLQPPRLGSDGGQTSSEALVIQGLIYGS